MGKTRVWVLEARRIALARPSSEVDLRLMANAEEAEAVLAASRKLAWRAMTGDAEAKRLCAEIVDRMPAIEEEG